jgi:hypothetical protein
MWVAIAAVAFTSVAGAETQPQNPKGFTHPVFEFLARSQSQNLSAHPGIFAHPGSRHASNSVLRTAAPGTWIAMLPVLFIGLVSPLILLPAATIRRLGRAPASPLLSALFQRPPPSLA